jgi:hypothetical protein
MVECGVWSEGMHWVLGYVQPHEDGEVSQFNDLVQEIAAKLLLKCLSGSHHLWGYRRRFFLHLVIQLFVNWLLRLFGFEAFVLLKIPH